MRSEKKKGERVGNIKGNKCLEMTPGKLERKERK